MSIRRLPLIENLNVLCDESDGGSIDQKEFAEWSNLIGFRLAEKPAGTVIDILSPIGRDLWTGEGVDSKYVASVLRGATGEVTVNINSPGGSYFEGLAIFTLLQRHPGKVVVNIIGTAASAASLIAMSGDLIRISQAGSIMIHNARAGVDGDRHDLEAGAAALGEIDGALRTIYAARTGLSDAVLDNMMTPAIGTWMFGQDAKDKGFADELLASEKIVEDKAAKAKAKSKTARAKLDMVLAKAGQTRTQRRELVRDFMVEAGRIIADPVDKTTNYAEIAESIRALKF